MHHPEVAQAHLVSLLKRGVRPDARVQAGIDADRHVGRQTYAFPAGDGHQLRQRDALLGHDADRLERADDRRAGLASDLLRAPQVIEVRVADDDKSARSTFEVSMPVAGAEDTRSIYASRNTTRSPRVNRNVAQPSQSSAGMRTAYLRDWPERDSR